MRRRTCSTVRRSKRVTPPAGPADSELKDALKLLDETKKELKVGEIKVRKFANGVETERRKARAHANNVQKRGEGVAAAAQADGANQAAMGGMIGRALRGVAP